MPCKWVVKSASTIFIQHSQTIKNILTNFLIGPSGAPHMLRNICKTDQSDLYKSVFIQLVALVHRPSLHLLLSFKRPPRICLCLLSASSGDAWPCSPSSGPRLCHGEPRMAGRLSQCNRQRGFDQGEIGLQDLAEISHSTSTGALQKALTGRTKKKNKGGETTCPKTRGMRLNFWKSKLTAAFHTCS